MDRGNATAFANALYSSFVMRRSSTHYDSLPYTLCKPFDPQSIWQNETSIQKFPNNSKRKSADLWWFTISKGTFASCPTESVFLWATMYICIYIIYKLVCRLGKRLMVWRTLKITRGAASKHHVNRDQVYMVWTHSRRMCVSESGDFTCVKVKTIQSREELTLKPQHGRMFMQYFLPWIFVVWWRKVSSIYWCQIKPVSTRNYYTSIVSSNDHIKRDGEP